jgi:hypothetical protein
MATLQSESTGELCYLRSLHMFGRNAIKADTVLVNQDASQIHATIRWNGQCWELLDHSRNGTFVNGKRIAANSSITLVPGQKIRLGPGAPQCWVVTELTAPGPMLLPFKGGTAIVLGSVHFLPDEHAPQASVYLGSNGLWMWENESDSVALHDGDRVTLGENSWRFFNAQKVEATLDVREHRSPMIAAAQFNFVVSQNEEHVCLSIALPDQTVDLGERTHHYSLLTLARRRVQDARQGLAACNQGWLGIDQLSAMLGMEPAHLNMQLFRARGQIAKQVPNHGALSEIVERRRGEVRFAEFHVEIIRGSQLEATFNPLQGNPPTRPN